MTPSTRLTSPATLLILPERGPIIVTRLHLQPPVKRAPAVTSQPPSLIPSLQAQLRAELETFRALGGPNLEPCNKLAAAPDGDVEDGKYQIARPDAMRLMAGQGLGELQTVADTVDQLSLKLNERLRLADLLVPVDKPTQPRAWVLFIRRAVRPG